VKRAALTAGVLTLFCVAPCFADDLPPRAAHGQDYTDPRLARGFTALTRPMGIAELGVGWLTLPGASVCAERSSGQGCKNGDTSFELDVWQIYRNSRRFAFGAGAMLGLIPTTDAPRHDPEEIVRDHSRSYLTIEGTIRHYPYVGEGVELWWGVAGGLAVVSDHFEVKDKNSDLALVGLRRLLSRRALVAKHHVSLRQLVPAQDRRHRSVPRRSFAHRQKHHLFAGDLGRVPNSAVISGARGSAPRSSRATPPSARTAARTRPRSESNATARVAQRREPA
jgi:hypothetical protein